MTNPLSEVLLAESPRDIPGGINSPVRAFRDGGGSPFFARRAHGLRSRCP